MKDKIIFITGASDGIGKEASKELAKLGAQVVMHGRNAEKLAGAARWVEQESGSNKVETILADLASFAQIRQLSELLHQRYDRLDVLVNNAGVQQHNFKLTEDGYESTLAINHLAYFLLTSLLMDLLEASDYRRIVNVASGMHYRAELDFDNLQAEKGYSLYPIYAQSKLCNVMFTYWLADQLKDSGITVNTLHPGLIDTHLNPQRAPEVVQRALPVEQGIISMMRCVTDPELTGISGRYFDSDGTETRSSEVSYDKVQQERLWRHTEELVGERFRFPGS